MRILMSHNYYRSVNPSGEAVSFEAEAALLEANGHQVLKYTRSNDEIAGYGPYRKARFALDTIWSLRTYRDIRGLIRRFAPHLVHCQNIFPLTSPSIYSACRAEGVPVIQSLRNYRTACPGGSMHRDGRPCHVCQNRLVPWPGVLHRCYRGSATATAAVASMLAVHRMLRTSDRNVDAFITNTEFSKRVLAGAGLPASRLHVKPNFVSPDPGPGRGGPAALFVGRLSPEKGVLTMLKAWERLPAIPLEIIGDGPLRPEVERAACSGMPVRYLGKQNLSGVYQAMRNSGCLIFPTEMYETFGRVAVEAFACGTPVVASAHGAIGEVVDHGRTGLHFRPGDPDDLASKVRRIFSDEELAESMRHEARREFLRKYTAERNYERLMEVYRLVVKEPVTDKERKTCSTTITASNPASFSA